jgi:hypothetical protein
MTEAAKIDVNKEVPLYKSHKTVRALEINICAMVAGGKRVVVFADKKYPSQTFDATMFVRYSPVPGDFLVIYEDGFKSFSPRKAFLEGYTLVEG